MAHHINRARCSLAWNQVALLKEYLRRFNHEAGLIPDLQDGVAYRTFLNGLLPGKFKFSLAESKVATLADALRKAQSFI